MVRKNYLSDNMISLSEYIDSTDDFARYSCWNDEETKSGYNHEIMGTFEEWKNKIPIRSRFIATIIRLSDDACVGTIFLSPEGALPDLAVMIYRPYRRQGLGTAAFALGAQYCFDSLKLDKIYAGCYSHNIGSMKMLKKCGFVPHPEGNLLEKHYATGEEITQFDFVKLNTNV